MRKGVLCKESKKRERTKDFVQSQSNLNPQGPSPVSNNIVQDAPSDNTFVTWDPPHNQSVAQPLQINLALRPPKKQATLPITKAHHSVRIKTKPKIEKINYSPSPLATPFLPFFFFYNATHNAPHPAETFAQYMARRDLITSGLYQYDDRPENFRAS